MFGYLLPKGKACFYPLSLMLIDITPYISFGDITKHRMRLGRWWIWFSVITHVFISNYLKTLYFKASEY